jgi:pimeloyl-ACP methyl ester carboxylesterase
MMGESCSPRAQVDGAALRYRRRGQGRPVVLLHPLRMQLEYFNALCPKLDDLDVELIAVDLPGHGHSTAPAVDYTASYFTNTIAAFLDALTLADAVMVGESIGASIALGLAARQCSPVTGIVALNPYDYGRWGGIRRSSTLANVVFTSMLLPLVGAVVARAGPKVVLRRVLEGGLYDPGHLTSQLVDELHRSGRRPGHSHALRSLSRNWQSWIAAREHYPAIQLPVTLVYGDHDWSNHDEQDANRRAIPRVRSTTIDQCGHFSSLEQPGRVADLIRDFLAMSPCSKRKGDR